MSIEASQCRPKQHSLDCGVNILKYFEIKKCIHYVYCTSFEFLSGRSQLGILYLDQICSLCIAFAVEVEIKWKLRHLPNLYSLL